MLDATFSDIGNSGHCIREVFDEPGIDGDGLTFSPLVGSFMGLQIIGWSNSKL